jgi:acyl-CoA synthetase (AMP-forming)/AMP-acid ligase II
LDIADRIRQVLTISPEARAMEFRDVWRTWADVAGDFGAVEKALDAAGLGRGAGVAVLVRNRPAQAAALLAIVASRRSVVSINPHQSAGAIAADIEALKAPAVLLEREDWDEPEIAAAARRSARLVLAIGCDAGGEAQAEVLHHAGTTPAGAMPDKPDVALQIFTSGTTGKPKRIDLAFKDLQAGIFNVLGENWARDSHGNLKVNTTPGLILNPFAHAGGLWFLFFLACDARSFVLLERFTVSGWVSAVKRHQLRTASLVPAAIRMVMDADVPKEDLASLVAVTVGTAPLPNDLWEAFEQRYGVALLQNYGSTEFSGAVVHWQMADHKRFIASKRGAAGRAVKGNTIRIVDPGSGAALPAGAEGLIEVSSTQLRGGEWIRTTDLGVLDQDGFLFIRGRADGAINRGGFKILPNEIEEVLLQHPGVQDAVVVGLPDARLGQIPAAAVEVKRGGSGPTADELREFARARLVAYKVPVSILIVDALPRSPSMKPLLPEVRALFAAVPCPTIPRI